LDGGASDDVELRGALELGAEVDDREVASTLVRHLSKRQIGRTKVDKKRRRDPRVAETQEVVSAADSSFLGRLSVVDKGGDEDRPHVSELEDVHVLLAVLRAGTLSQRRAATRRLGDRLEEGKLSNDDLRSVSTTLLSVRDVEIGFEVSRAIVALPGARGREARAELDAERTILDELVPKIEEFWSGQRTTDPVADLPPDERARLMVGLRDAPELVLALLSSVLDGSDGVNSREARHALLSSVRFSGDPRLVPPLVGLLSSRHPDFCPDAARALAYIDDPRAHPAIAAAYERTPTDFDRVVFAGALAMHDDVRGRDYARGLLSVGDERVLLAAVEAMEGLSTKEDCELLSPLLEKTDPELLRHVVRALGHTGDARALHSLMLLRRASGMSALWADIEEAEAEIRAVMELRGEEPPAPEESLDLATAAQSGAAERKRDPAIVRLQSWWDFVMGHLWLGLGSSRRAIKRFERSASRRPGWVHPLAALALHHARKDRPAQALAAFRRALEIDRGSLERNLYAIRELARIFLRRADDVEKTGRVDIARGLIEEVLSLDLRRVPSELRFELSRRHERLRSST